MHQVAIQNIEKKNLQKSQTEKKAHVFRNRRNDFVFLLQIPEVIH